MKQQAENETQSNSTEYPKELKENELFQELSDYKPSFGLVGHFFNWLSTTLDGMAGLSEKRKDLYVDSLEHCKKYYLEKEKDPSSVKNAFSRYGDIYQVDDHTFVDCGRKLMNIQQFHVFHSPMQAMASSPH